MEKFYATSDFDGDRIEQNAHIVAFDNREDAVAFLMQGYDSKEWDYASAVIEPGRFSDCWVKTLKAPQPTDRWFAPFAFDDLYVLPPGQHPGGNMYWTSPLPDVLVVASIRDVAGDE